MADERSTPTPEQITPPPAVARRRHLFPFWALQLTLGLVALLMVIGLFAALLGVVAHGPSAFLDELGRTVTRLLPGPQADVRTDAQLKALIAATPDGKLRVGTAVDEQDRVVFIVTADRSAVHAAIRPGDQLRISKSGEVEIVPIGLPGVIDGAGSKLDELRRKLDDLRKRFFGNGNGSGSGK